MPASFAPVGEQAVHDHLPGHGPSKSNRVTSLERWIDPVLTEELVLQFPLDSTSGTPLQTDQLGIVWRSK